MFKKVKEMDKKEVMKKVAYGAGIILIGGGIAYLLNRNYDPMVDIDAMIDEMEEELEVLKAIQND